MLLKNLFIYFFHLYFHGHVPTRAYINIQTNAQITRGTHAYIDSHLNELHQADSCRCVNNDNTGVPLYASDFYQLAFRKATH